MTDYALRLSEDEIDRYRLMAASARAGEAAEWALAGITTGARVADVGCGPGALLPLLSDEVGPGGRVEAIDGDDAAVAAATALVAATALPNVTVSRGRADATGLEAGAFDAVMTRHLLAHNGTAAQGIVSHLATLLKPGGAALLVDIDMTAFRFRPDEAGFLELMDRYAAFQQARGGDMRIGLRLDELLGGAGLDVVAYRGLYDVVTPPPGIRGPAWAARDAMLDAGIVTEAEIARWGAAFDEREAAGATFTMFAPRFVAVGRRTG